MHADRWSVHTKRGYVVVYGVKPSQAPDGEWRSRGFLHQWSPRDARWLGLSRRLPVDVPCLTRFTTDARSGSWWFVRDTDADVWLYVRCWWWPWGKKAQPFCPKMLSAAGVPGLPVGVPLGMTFPET